MADRTVKYVLTANASGFTSAMKTARMAVKDVNADLAKNGQSAEQYLAKYEQSARGVTTGLGLVGAAAVAGAGLAIKTYATFDRQMSAVKATGGATTVELNKLREAAIGAGAKTAFSATEAAAGIENLLKAGVTAQDVLGGGLNGTLDLAASGALSVADAAEIAAGAMTQFKLGGEDVTHIADVLSAGAGKAQGDVSDLAGALKYAGVPVAQLGVTLEETTGTLALFASNAIVGEQAGTSLRSMVSSLTSPSKVAAKEMESLGINVFDSQGKFVGLAGTAEQLKTRMSRLTDEERANSLGRIFGNESLQAANVLYDAGAEKVRKWTKDVDDQGYAAKTAAARLDNLSGDIEAFGGSVETAFIRAGSGGNDVLRGMVQGATDLVNALGRIDGSVLSGITLALGAGGVLALGAAGAGKLVIGLNNANAALKDFGVSWKTVGKTATVAGGLVGLAAVGLQVWAQEAATARSQTDEYIATLDSLGQITDATMRTLSTRISEDQGNWVENIFGKNPGTILDQAKEIGVATEDVQAAILGNSAAYDKVTAAARRYAEEGGARVNGTMLNASQYAERFTMAIDDQSGRLSDAQKEQAQKTEADKAAGLAQDELNANYQTTTGAIDEQVASLAELIEAQQKAAGVVLEERDARRQYQEQLDSAKKALKENGETLDITTEKGRANQEVLDGISDKALAVAASMEQNGRSQAKVQEVIKRARKDYVDMATGMGMPLAKARALADTLGLVAGNYVADVEVNTAAASTALRDFLVSIERADGTLKIKGDGAPAAKTLDEVTTQVNEADGSVTIRAKDGSAIATLSDYTAKVDDSDGTVTIKGKDKQGRETVLKLTSWVGDQKPDIKVGADTSSARRKGESTQDYFDRMEPKIDVGADTSEAQRAVSKFVVQNGGMTIKVGARVISQMGDGEGAGWTGGTPRGVAAMTKAVHAIDGGARITSGYRPGAVTATGYPSYHGMGRAIDIVSPNMGRTFDLLARAFGSKAKELYYTPRGFIRNGHYTNDVAAVTRRTHRSHVHLALNGGGRLPGMPPVDPREDNLLGVDEHGMPLARVRSREWLVNEPASDYYGDDIMSAINGRRIPRDSLAALQGLAGGGRLGGGGVGAAERALAAAKLRRDRTAATLRDARAAVKDAERAERTAQKSKMASDDKAAARKLSEAERKADRLEREYDKRKDEVSRQSDRLSNLRDERTQFGTDLRRSDILAQATSGAAGAYSVVDQMLGLARSGDLTKSQSRTLAARAGKAEWAMRGLYRQAESLDKRLESAKGRLEDIASIKASVGSALAGGFTLGGVEGTVNPWTGKAEAVTGKQYLAAARGYAGKVKAFASKLGALRKKGFAGVILEEVAGMGVEVGIPAADALLGLGQADSKSLNTAYKSIATYSTAAGTQVAEAFGLSAAQSLVKSLGKQDAKVEKAIRNWGVYMADGLALALTGKKSGLKKRAMGGPMSAGEPYLTGELGPELIVPVTNSYALTAEQTRRLASTSTGGMQQHITVTTDAAALASALNGVTLTLDVEGKPISGIVRSTIKSAVTGSAALARGGKR
ncbi:phage tail tape measure protein [Isoptericola sp. NPDC055881]